MANPITITSFFKDNPTALANLSKNKSQNSKLNTEKLGTPKVSEQAVAPVINPKAVDAAYNYAQGKVNLQNDATWNSYPEAIRKAAFAKIQADNTAKGLDPNTGQAPSSGNPYVDVVNSNQAVKDKVSNTINELGLSNAGVADLPMIFQATFSKEELMSMGLSEGQANNYLQTEQNRFNAQQNLMSTPKPTNSMLAILQTALKEKTKVNQQELGQSSLFEQAGLSGYATLMQSLAYRSQEMQDKYTSYADVIQSTAGAMKDAFNTALDRYNVLNEDYQAQVAKIDKIVTEQRQLDQQIVLMQEEAKIQEEMAKNTPTKWAWDSSRGAFVNDKGEIKYVDLQTSDAYSTSTATGSNYQVVEGDPYQQYADNCVKYARAYVPNLPYGLWNKEDKQAAVDLSITNPKIGDVVLTGEGAYGHAAVIMGIQGDNLILKEANYRSGAITYGRVLNKKDSNIYGYISPANSVQANTVVNFSEDAQKNEGINPNGAETFGGQSVYGASSMGDLKQQFNNVSLSIKEKFRAETASKQFKQYMANGQYKQAEELINLLAIESLGSGTRRQNYDNAVSLYTNANKAISLIDELQYTDFGYYKNLIEENKPYAKVQKDQQFTSIVQLIGLTQATLRNDLFGASLTDNELTYSNQFLVDPTKDDIKTVMTKLKGLVDFGQQIKGRMLNDAKGIAYSADDEPITYDTNPLGL